MRAHEGLCRLIEGRKENQLDKQSHLDELALLLCRRRADGKRRSVSGLLAIVSNSGDTPVGKAANDPAPKAKEADEHGSEGGQDDECARYQVRFPSLNRLSKKKQGRVSV